MLNSKRFIYLMCLLMAFLLVFCNQEKATDVGVYLNLQDSVAYMGMETCKSCHADVHATFKETGMGKSFDLASQEKTAATFGAHALVYDQLSDFYYQPFFRADTLWVKEFRLQEGDTIHQRTESIQYIIGSGQHTNSHIVNENGYIYQAPITYYTQDKKWDMAPGFENKNLRFSRLLTSECMTCHNHFPVPEKGSINKFVEMPRGIECERCHGPGEVHVLEKLEGRLVDTSIAIDYSIVNPRHLSRDRQMDICQRCHLQGVAVLEAGKSWYDFKPGMSLSEIMNVFLPRYSNTHEKFIMASQADRLRMSPCFQLSEELSCLTCHNPHHSVASTSTQSFNATCQSCHQSAPQSLCSESMTLRNAVDDNCIHCHMPSSGSIDIPHVNITDHYISKQTAQRAKEIPANEQSAIADFLGLEMMTKKVPKPLDMARGYIATYDKYIESEVMLDSAAYYLKQSNEKGALFFQTQVHYYFAREDYEHLRQLAETRPLEKIEDAWTAYRLGEAFMKAGEPATALGYLKRATTFLPLHLEFQEKLGNAYVGLKQLKEAEATYQFVIAENPKRKTALCNLGFVQVMRGKQAEGMLLYNRALALDPDYIQALLNKAALLLLQKNHSGAKLLLEQILQKEPQNVRAQTVLEKIKQL